MAENWRPGDLDPCNVPLSSWEFIYSNGGWNGEGAGPGSTIANNSELITWLKNFINTNSCSSIVDMGCGQLQWVTQVLNNITYTGIDWVTNVNNTNKTTHPSYTFLTSNIAVSSFNNNNSYDILICKDVIHHSMVDLNQIITNIGNITATHKIIIVPEAVKETFNDTLTEEGYTLTKSYSADELKNIYLNSN
jgi:hypothetical protein